MNRLLLFVLLTFAFEIHAQEKKLIPFEFNVERGNRFQQALQFQNGLVTVYGRSDWFFYSSRLTLHFHDASGNMTRDRKLQLQTIGQPAFLLHALSSGDTLYFICAVPFTGKNEMGWCVLAYDYANDKIIETVSANVSNTLQRSWLLSGQTEIVFSPDSSFAAVCVFSPIIPGKQQSVNVLAFEFEDPQYIRVQAAALPNENRYQTIQSLIDNRGAVYMLGKSYKNALLEIQNGKPNYTYKIHRLENSMLKPVCELPDNRVLRSLAGVVLNDVFYGNALVGDSLLSRHDSIYTVRFSLNDCNDLSEQITALATESELHDSTVVSFSNLTTQTGNQIVALFEQRRVVNNESAKSSGGLAYERGKALVGIFDSTGHILQTTTINKRQRFDDQPLNSIHVFEHRGLHYAAYPEYRDTSSRNSVFVLRNLYTHEEQSFPLMHADWKKEDVYYLIKTSGSLLLLQQRMRSYALFRIALP